MAKKKYIQIDSTRSADVNEAFSHLCKEVLDKKPSEVKREVLKFKGHEKDRSLNIHDLISFCQKANVEMEFRFIWTAHEITPEDKALVESRIAAIVPVQEESVSALEQEASDITNPDLQEEIKSPTHEVKSQLSPPPGFDTKDLPDFLSC